MLCFVSVGRKKIQITRIQDERNRQITFSKRKAGLLKKAYELSILCDVEIAVIMITGGNKLYQYASTNMNSILIRYTEFKDPDESKTNADILDDINRRDKDKGIKDGLSGDEDDEHANLPLTPNTHAHYQRIDEEFDQVLRQENTTVMTAATAQHKPRPPPPPPVIVPPPPPAIVLAATSSNIPQAMPVSVPVTSPDLRLKHTLGSTGSSSRQTSASTISSPDTPGGPKSIKSPSSAGSMPPPAGTPTRLQTIRNQTLKLHLPGGGRSYVPLSSPGSVSPKVDDKASDKQQQQQDTNESSTQHNRPQLKVVIPGQKGFIPKTAPSSPPPPIMGMETPPNDKQPSKSTTSTLSTTAAAAAKNDSLTTPIMSLTTPSIFSSTIPPSLSSLPTEFPLSSVIGDGGLSTSALVAFPISIQPGGNTPGNNLIIQAQNMGQPFLLTPTPSDKQNASLTPPSSFKGDLEQLKMQYDKIYQQISETLQYHEQNKSSSDDTMEGQPTREGNTPSTDGGGTDNNRKRANNTTSLLLEDEATKKARLDS